MTTQLEALDKYFRRHSRLTQHQATIELGIMRLSERIRELEAKGWVFLHNRIEVPTRYTKAFVTQYVFLQRPKRK
jgi:Helix-turn-helix domain